MNGIWKKKKKKKKEKKKEHESIRPSYIYGLIWQTGFLTPVSQPLSDKENWIQTSFAPLKNLSYVKSCQWRRGWVYVYVNNSLLRDNMIVFFFHFS